TYRLMSSEISTSSSVVITSLYQRIFNTKTKFSGPLVRVGKFQGHDLTYEVNTVDPSIVTPVQLQHINPHL
ncbi:8260_t:CDS:1, partial [Diversispora eburnea]